jgi:hypothetical protein
VLAVAVLCLVPAGCYPSGDPDAGKQPPSDGKAYYDRLPKDDGARPVSPQFPATDQTAPAPRS